MCSLTATTPATSPMATPRNLRAPIFLLGWLLLIVGASASAQPLHILVIGAHPDDADVCAGGTAALWAEAGHRVKFLSLTNGDAGHQSMGREALAERRFEETQQAAKQLGIAEYQVFDNHDGELLPTLAVREQVIKAIRQWQADVVIMPRPNDYHPDHRNAGLVVQDATYMVMVPLVVPDVPPLRRSPVYLYCRDEFKKPNPFTPDIVVDVDSVFDKKINALAAHQSQFYEWLPWAGGTPDAFKGTPEQNKKLLGAWLRSFPVADDVRASLKKWYGNKKGAAVKQAEAFEICEYGTQPDESGIRRLFPMLEDN